MFFEIIELFSKRDKKRKRIKLGPNMGSNGDDYPKDSSLFKKVSLCIGCSLSSNTKY